MSRRWLPAPQTPDEAGEADGRPYLLWLPRSAPPWPGMVICHGAGSRKENHADFGRLCAASGWAALAFDQRGHGEASDSMSVAAIDDVAGLAALLAERDGVDPRRVCVRGSSMGGFMAIHAAARSSALAGVIAICPAGEEQLARGLREQTLEMRISERDRAGLLTWLSEHEIGEAVELLGTRPKILIHARGDERIPYSSSQRLFERAAEPRRLILLPGGTHRSAQHDPELQAESLRWLGRALARAGS